MKNTRLLSLDILRGFDMFWIIGGELLIWSLRDATDFEWLHILGDQMIHVPWEGFHFYDLIFSLFMFISGVSIPYSMRNQRKKGKSNKALFNKIVKRTAILVSLGVVYNGFFYFDFENLRYASVLGQIGVAYCIAALINLYVPSFKKIVGITIALMLTIAIIQLFIPVPGIGAGVLTPEGNINAYIDNILLPGKFNGVIFDSQGIFCMISAAVLPLMGSIVGRQLAKNENKGEKLALMLFISGMVLALLGVLAGYVYPIVKHLWTTTFNLLTGGISIVLMAIFYYVFDVKKITINFPFFKVIGMNSILIYLAHRMVNFRATSDFLFSGMSGLFGSYKEVIQVIGFITVEWLFLWFMFKNKIFIKV